MSSVLTSAVTIRVAGRAVLRACPVRRGSGLLLVERDGTEISAETPVAALLDRSDLIAALRPGGAPVETFWGGTARFSLRLRRVAGGAELILEAGDGQEWDAHQTPIRAVFPQLSGPIRAGLRKAMSDQV